MYNFIIGMMLLFILLPGMGFPETYYVKPDGDDYTSGTSWETAFQTITKATDVASSGSQVWVKQGTYKEGDTIEIAEGVSCYGSFAGIETDLEQRDLSTSPTIIDGEESFQCLINHGTFDGFHVTRGMADTGGGIYNFGTVQNCKIYFNQSSFDGGGIINNSGTVKNCDISSNTARLCMWYGYGGGGICNYFGTVENCRIFSNKNADMGGGIHNRGTVKRCEVFLNEAEIYGGGIYNRGGSVYFCQVYSNSSAVHGGGIYNEESQDKCINCLIYNNTAGETDSMGGGIYYGVVMNCTLYNNTASSGGGIHGAIVGNTISWNNTGHDISLDSFVLSSCFGEAGEENGNINQNPLFENIAGNISIWDFHLQDGSPCIDAGDPGQEYYDECLPPGKGKLRNDMGAFGGPFNCWSDVFMNKQHIIDYLLGRNEISPDYKSCADCNTDTIIDIADVVQFMLP